MRRSSLRLLPWSLLPVLMAGCSTLGVGDVQRWVADQRAHAVPYVKPVSEPKPYTALPYTEAGVEPDPFNSERLIKAWGPGVGQDLIEECRNRRPQPLEAFPLDAISMVGSINRKGKQVALVKVDKLLYQVLVGNYLGQNCGLVTQVSENQVTLREIVQDGGIWTQRKTTLQLQENTK